MNKIESKEQISDALRFIMDDDLKTIKKNRDMPNLLTTNEIKPKQLNGAISSYAKGCKPDDITILCDTTLFQNGKQGMIFTKDGIYNSYFNFLRKKDPISQPVKYADLDSVEVSKNGSDIILNYRDGRKEEVYTNIYTAFTAIALDRIINMISDEPKIIKKSLICDSKDTDICYFKNDENFIGLKASSLGDSYNFIKEDERYDVIFSNGTISVEVPEYEEFKAKMAKESTQQTKISQVIPVTEAFVESNDIKEDETESEQYERKTMSCDRKNKNVCYFVDDQGDITPIKVSLIGDSYHFMKEEASYDVIFLDGKPIRVDIPDLVDLKVIETSSNGSNNQIIATLETGAKINVPLFIDVDDIIRIDTHSGKYVKVVKKAHEPEKQIEHKLLVCDYKEEDVCHFVDDDYNVIDVEANLIGDNYQYIKEEESYDVIFSNGKVIGIDMPEHIEVKATEIKDDTVKPNQTAHEPDVQTNHDEQEADAMLDIIKTLQNLNNGNKPETEKTKASINKNQQDDTKQELIDTFKKTYHFEESKDTPAPSNITDKKKICSYCAR